MHGGCSCFRSLSTQRGRKQRRRQKRRRPLHHFAVFFKYVSYSFGSIFPSLFVSISSNLSASAVPLSSSRVSLPSAFLSRLSKLGPDGFLAGLVSAGLFSDGL